MDNPGLTPHEKALQINLDPDYYGTFAEIGAGQEVARWFFRVGGAAGTVAKSMSAYDMTFSDAIYGQTRRYVSRDRLKEMLDHEYGLLRERLTDRRGESTRFFVFADTVAVRGFRNTGDCHAWLGVRFQTRPDGPVNDLVVHCNLEDTETVLQQEAVGILGVNLVYAAFACWQNLDVLLGSLSEGLAGGRLLIDYLYFSGTDLAIHDNRVANLKLVKNGLSKGALFAPDGSVMYPGDLFYRRPVLIERGYFRPVARVHLEMLSCARAPFAKECGQSGEGNPVEVLEITMNNLLTRGGELDLEDFLARVDLIGCVGKHVLISDIGEFYRLQHYLERYTRCRIGIVLGAPLLREVFDEKYYDDLAGGILESFGRLFKNGLKLYVFPNLSSDGEVLNAVNIQIPGHLRHLHLYLLENGFVVDLSGEAKPSPMLRNAQIVDMISGGDHTWESWVPDEVAEVIRGRGFFGNSGIPD